MVSNLFLSEKLQSRLSRSFHASRALRFVPKSLRFLFLEFPETFKLFSSCPSSFHLPEVSRLPFAGFLCYEIFMVLALFGHRPLFQRTSVILPSSELFVSHFFYFFPSFFLALRGRSHLTACLYYQIIPSLSTPFSKLFYLFFSPPVFAYRPAIHVPLKNKTPD